MNKQPKCRMCNDTGWYFFNGKGNLPELVRCYCMKKTDTFFVILVAVIVVLCVIFSVIACF